MRNRRLIIAGTGAMACLFGARLSPYVDVTLLGSWPAGLAAVSRTGIRLGAGGNPTVAHVRATTDPAACAGARMALVLVKSWQTARVAAQLATCLADDAVVLTFQNGLGNLEKLQACLGTERAALGVTTTGATLIGPGHVRHGGDGPICLADHSRLEHLAGLLQDAGFGVQRLSNLDGAVWGKLAINAGINPVTALLRVENGGLVQDSAARMLAVAAAQEVAAVATACGIRLPFTDAGEALLAVAKRTAGNRSSMYQDILRGAPTEIGAICGAVVRKGEEFKVPTPVNRTLWRLVREQTTHRAGVAA